MLDSRNTPARKYAKGMGKAVADRTINRRELRVFKRPAVIKVALLLANGDVVGAVDKWAKENDYEVKTFSVVSQDNDIANVKITVTGKYEIEEWEDVAYRVALGNSLLAPNGAAQAKEFEPLHHHLRQASLLMSGRHLQHGDATQPSRNQEVFTNCGRGDTELLTLEHGPVTLAEVAGTSVTVRCVDGVWRKADAKKYGKQQLFKLTFSRVGSGPKTRRDVYFTGNHRWLLESGKITDSIKIGDRLASMPYESSIDPGGVVHGLVFGDGSAHKQRVDHSRPGVSQGRTYASLRVCKQDVVKDEIVSVLTKVGYTEKTPAWANGDSVFYIGKFEYSKELPYCTDPEYISGFIHGWWLADGHKTEANGTVTISTVDTAAVDWLVKHCGYAGLTLLSHATKERKTGDGSFENGEPLHVIRLRKDVVWELDSVEPSMMEEVYCVEEPVTKSFTLANGLVTGNCSTSATSFTTFYLLLNGSGVGRCYDDDMMVLDWSNLPTVVTVVDSSHMDVQSGLINAMDKRTAEHLYADKEIINFEVPDSREGWAKAIEVMEALAYKGDSRDKVLILDFSKVRPKGSPIAGMQNRPASGPGPLISAINNVIKVRDAGMGLWRQAMYVDHYLAECVLVGGARRAARMSTKHWTDRTVLDFISVKRGGFLWSSNNSVTVDRDFWNNVRNYIELPKKGLAVNDTMDWAFQVFREITEAAYNDGTGEPGFINQDMLVTNDQGLQEYLETGEFIGSAKYQLYPATKDLTRHLAAALAKKPYRQIVNPCAEITLLSLGGYCTIADVVPYHAQDDDDAEDAFRTATRALIRVNTMDCLYGPEVKRTNRIGVGMTGLHEYAWKRFGYGWEDLVDEQASLPFWNMLSRFKRAVVQEAAMYSERLRLVTPHTNTTMKPAGTTSKLFGLTEGAHLAAMKEYLRWVQLRSDDPLVRQYEKSGYPVKHLKTYSGTTIVGFPTRPEICKLGMGDKLVTAGEATPADQYEFIRLLEKYWIVGVNEQGTSLVDSGNQISYTLKYDPKKVSLEQFQDTILTNQSTVKCCSVMPQTDTSEYAYEYLPEHPVTKHEYEMILEAINDDEMKEDIGREHVDCSSGACPIDFGKNSASETRV